MKILVKNTPPRNIKRITKETEIFQKYIKSDTTYPFEHQFRTFELVNKNQNIFLVAGTAAGKTLAIAIPLFRKLLNNEVKRLCFIYPTIALMEDQSKVMNGLIKACGLNDQATYLRGGMSRTELMESLSRRVILSTPDEIYWFFQKSVKFSSLLIYGLCKVDEFVLDEAHLFNGLALLNLKHFFNRIKFLQENFIHKNQFRLHILTATPSEKLQTLNNGAVIEGKSKCGDVYVDFQLSDADKQEKFVQHIEQTLKQDFRKILVISNSAAFAHRLFCSHANHSRKSTDKLISQLYKILDTVDLYPNNRSPNKDPQIYYETIFMILSLVLTQFQRQIINKVATDYKASPSNPPRWILNQLASDNELSHWASVFEFDECRELADYKTIIDDKFDSIINRLDFTLFNTDFLISSASKEEAAKVIEEAYLDLDDGIINQILSRYTRLAWMGQQHLKALSKSYLKSSYDKSFNNVAVWQKTDVPVILYTGSLSKPLREGVIKLFDALAGKVILISTSAVEVGVDFSADYMITEQSPANSFLQRFGRVGRHTNHTTPSVTVLVDGIVFSKVRDFLEDKNEINREDFSAVINQTFPEKEYIDSSDIIDAVHFITNQNLGIIGAEINKNVVSENARLSEIIHQIRKYELNLSYGLRGTIPNVSLKDAGVSKDPFYIFRYVDDSLISPAESPFELAKIDAAFNQIIFTKKVYDIKVDLRETQKATKALFVPDGAHLKIVGRNYEGTQQLLDRYKAILLFTDVFLEKFNEVEGSNLLKNRNGKPVVIKDQFLLIIYGQNDLSQLRKCRLADLEELHYDSDWNGNSYHDNMLILVDKVQGACFSVYKTWINECSSRNIKAV